MKLAKTLLGVASAFSFLFVGAACSSTTTEEVEADVDETVKDAEADVEGAENDVKDTVGEAVDTTAQHIGTFNEGSILEHTDTELVIESLEDKDSLLAYLQDLETDGKLTFKTEDKDGGTVVTSIDDIEAADGTEWVLYSSLNEWDGQAITDEATSIEYDGKVCGKVTVPTSEVPFQHENYYIFVLE